MSGPNGLLKRAVDLQISDGAELPGDLAVPDYCRAAAVVCHPHPQFGGDRFNHVVGALFTALPAAGVAALRFDFRQEYGEGVAEVLDVQAAIDVLADAVPGVPILVTGYSFGAVVALVLDDDRVRGKVLVAPPLGTEPRPAPGVSTLVLTPAQDQFCPPSTAEPMVSTWPEAELRVVETADHFLVGRTGVVVDETVAWIDDLLT
ncbi:MAG: alpha/beta hydrolase [Ilumatobacteraceae bacterium]